MTVTAALQNEGKAQRKWRHAAPWGALFVLALGTLTYLPALRTPLLLDDYMHAAMVEGTFGAPRGPFDLYDFVNDADRPLLIQRGMLPWWAHPRLVVRFFRPLSSALRWADQKAFGSAPVVPHLHSLAWWMGAVLAARALFRRAFSPRIALLATAIFALGPWHVLPLAWLANREALVTLAFGTLALGAYVRWREGGRQKDFAWALVLFTLTVLAGEYAVCFAGYVLAIEWLRSRESLARRALGVVPFVLPMAAYLGVRAALGYGTVASGFYADPLHDPLAYLRAAPMRVVTLLAEGWLTLGTNAWGTTMPKWALAIVVPAGALLAFVPLKRAIASLDTRARATAKWLLLGSFLALAPVLAVVPAPRLLGIGALGIAASTAILLDFAWFPRARLERRVVELTGLVATALAFAQLVHGPVASWLAAEELRRSQASFATSAKELRAGLPDLPASDIGVVRGMAEMFFGPFTLDPRGAPPGHWQILAHGGHVLVLRKGARSLEMIAPRDNGVYPMGAANLFRSENAPLRAGDEIEVPGMRVTILEAGEHGPYHVRFDFERDLDTAGTVWIEESFDGFRAAILPRPGFGSPFDPK